MRKSCETCKHEYKEEREKPCVNCQIPPYSEYEPKKKAEDDNDLN